MKVLVLYAHPDHARSRVNRRLRDALHNLPDVSVFDLYAHYPNGFIDVAEAQSLALAHDVIVFQHPLFWYSCPALLKEWIDRVLAYGWAYGQNQAALAGRYLLSAISAGGAEHAYQQGGINRHPLQNYLLPFEQIAFFCGMTYLPPFITYASTAVDDATLNAQAQAYRACIQGLTEQGRLSTTGSDFK